MLNVYRILKFLSIHDVLTARADQSDPTNTSDKGPQPAPSVLVEKPKPKLSRNPPLRQNPPQAPNLRFVSIHDVLTPRDGDKKNSDPTMEKDKNG